MSGHQRIGGELRALIDALGARLLGDGLPAHRIEEAIERLGRALGVDVSAFGLPTVLLVSAGVGTPLQMVRPVGGGVDLERLDRLHGLVGAVERGELSPEAAATHAVALGEASPHAAGARGFAAGAVAAGSCLLLGGAAFESALSASLGAWVGVGAERHGSRMRMLPVVVAAVASAAAMVAMQLGWIEHPFLVAVSALVPLLPGMTMSVAVTELSTGHWVSGTARLAGALTTVCQLVFGLSLGFALAERQRGLLFSTPTPGVGSTLAGVLVLVLGLVLLVRVPKSVRLGAGLLALSGFGVLLAARDRFGPSLATGLSTFAVALVSFAFARWRDRPSSLLLVPSVGTLVPGMLALSGFSAAAFRDVDAAIPSLVQLTLTLFSLTTGLMLASTVLPPRTLA